MSVIDYVNTESSLLGKVTNWSKYGNVIYALNYSEFFYYYSRHMILSAGPVFNEEQWTIACLTLHKACVLSFHPLMQLMAAFYPSSQSFYGDMAQVKVAARRDSTVEENCRIKQLSHQVLN